MTRLLRKPISRLVNNKLAFTLGQLIKLIVVFALIIFACTKLSSGRKAPDFTLQTVGGESVRFSQYVSNRNSIVIFWATWCPACRASLEKLKKNIHEFEKRNIKIVLVNLREEKSKVQAFAEENSIYLDIFLDTDAKVGESYGVKGIPQIYFIDKKGRIKSKKHHIPKDYDTLF